MQAKVNPKNFVGQYLVCGQKNAKCNFPLGVCVDVCALFNTLLSLKGSITILYC